MLRDIRELIDSPEEYAAELRRRWGGLLSYRYIGRSYAVMDVVPEDNTVTLRHDMRNTSGGVLFAVFGISAPESGHMSDLEAVPNPVIHSCQIVDAGRDVRRIEIVSEELKVGRQMGYSRAKIVDADPPDRVLALIEGQGVTIGTPPEGLERMEANPLDVVDSPDCLRCGRCSAATAGPTATGDFPNSRSRSLHPMRRCISDPNSSSWKLRRRTPRRRWRHRPCARRLSARDVPRAGQGRPVPRRDRADDRRRRHVAVRVLMRDEGNGDRLITTASYQFRSV